MIGLMLLTVDDLYLVRGGTSDVLRLPSRPKYDKCILQALCVGRAILCSKETANKLPSTIIKVAEKIYIDNYGGRMVTDDIINLGVSTYKNNLPDILYIVRSPSGYTKGKVFRYKETHGYEKTIVVCDTKLEVWRRAW